jgi:hypothetical protein
MGDDAATIEQFRADLEQSRVRISMRRFVEEVRPYFRNG